MNKRNLCFAFLLFMNYCIGQKLSITPIRNNIVYLGVNNPLTALAEGVSCQSIFLSTENGTLSKTDCYFSYYPKFVDDAKIKILEKKNNQLKELGYVRLRARDIPPPVAYVGGNSGDTIRLKEFQAQQGVRAGPEPSLGFELSYKVESFNFCLYRSDSVLFHKKNTGNIFTIEINHAIQGIQKDDIIVLSQIKCLTPGGKILLAKPIEFFIN